MNHSIPFKNEYFMQAPAFAVMRCTGIDVREGEMYLKMEQPNDEFQRFYYVNGPTAVGPNSYGRCYALDSTSIMQCPALYETGDGEPELDETWGPRDGSWKLQKPGYGFTILGNHDDGRVFVRQHEVTIIMGNLNETLDYHDSAEMTVAAESTSVGIVEVHDHLLQSGHHLPSSARVVAAWMGGAWRLVSSAECPELDE